MPPNTIKEGLAFDDVLLLPAYSTILPRDVDTSTRLTNSIRLNIPLLSSAMDTVTESRMAIAIAQEGGMGIIHKNLTIEEQAAEVDKVKKYESVVIMKPRTLEPEQRLADALQIKRMEQISSFPIVKNGRLVGILTNRDLRFEKNLNKKISEVMIKNVITAPAGTSIEKAKEILHRHRVEKLPLVDKNGQLKGFITFTDIEKREKYPNSCKDKLGRLMVGAAVGVSFDREERVEALLQAGADVIVIDTAHGHSKGVINATKDTRKNFPKCQLIAGNVGTYEGAEALLKAGVDALKVGIGPGSICTTRIVTGVGVPQISAIMNCVAAVRKKDIPVIADGGIKYSGDIVKAIAAGADSVMIGGLFAGTDESPGETVLYQGRIYKIYRGMGSIEAMKKGSKDRYFQDDVESELKLVPEGIEGRVPHKGPVSSSIFQLIGGLKSGMGYCGTRTISELRKKARLVKITVAGLRESHVHDVIITKEAPNYKIGE
ncbi:MAG TPA: IMP dehydrogenase [Deltaproteobacteria bacterium]|nr:MAG: IMP dehydrogenase [Deltaproteobacteria bacterium GWF2_42_12]OGQ26480.1 MAG: IMP dehydrogenase [Deltaproteobacteria bacterium RIFCSPHIGHO2_02_FULL_42_44]HCY18697.1 IMP dehydrogenase [Deltaproteobacteria bacterium]